MRRGQHPKAGRGGPRPEGLTGRISPRIHIFFLFALPWALQFEASRTNSLESRKGNFLDSVLDVCVTCGHSWDIFGLQEWILLCGQCSGT